MSLGIAFKGPEGIVLAADSRVTLLAQTQADQRLIPATFDNATKLLKVNGQKYVGAVTYGLGAIGGNQPRTAHSFLPEFEDELSKELESNESGDATEKRMKRLTVEEFAQRLSDFFMKQWGESMPSQYQGEPLIFLVGGYNPGDAYGKVFEFFLPYRPQPVEQNKDDFGVTWGGQLDITTRLINGFDPKLPGLIQMHLGLDGTQTEALQHYLKNNLSLPIPYQFLPLQDCVDLSMFLIRTTTELQAWQVGIRGVGGAIDVATITRTRGFKPVQEKEIVGERRGLR